MTAKSVPAVVLCDLDGVIWLSHQPIPGSPEAVARLRAAGSRVLFVTNNSSAVVADQEAALAGIGIPAAGDVVTSAMAAAALVQPGERVLVCGGPGIVEAVERAGAVAVANHDDAADLTSIDTVMVGFHRSFDFERMRRAAAAVRHGARLIGTNDDATYPTPDGPIPGGGSILAAVETACGVKATVAGKPHQTMADYVAALVGAENAARAVMIGDRPSTDGGFARTLGCTWALVYSGVTAPGAAADPVPDITALDMAGIATQLGA